MTHDSPEVRMWDESTEPARERVHQARPCPRCGSLMNESAFYFTCSYIGCPCFIRKGPPEEVCFGKDARRGR